MQEIGMETRPNIDQFFRFEEGEGKVIIDGVEHRVKDGDAVIVPAGAKHNVVNTSKKSELKLYLKNMTVSQPSSKPLFSFFFLEILSYLRHVLF